MQADYTGGTYPLCAAFRLCRGIVLDDNIPNERETALTELWMFSDTISDGMKGEIERASKHGIPIRFISGVARPSTVAAWIESELGPERYTIDDAEKLRKQGKLQ